MRGVKEDGKNQVWEIGMVDGVIRQSVGQGIFPQTSADCQKGQLRKGYSLFSCSIVGGVLGPSSGERR